MLGVESFTQDLARKISFKFVLPNEKKLIFHLPQCQKLCYEFFHVKKLKYLSNFNHILN